MHRYITTAVGIYYVYILNTIYTRSFIHLKSQRFLRTMFYRTPNKSIVCFLLLSKKKKVIIIILISFSKNVFSIYIFTSRYRNNNNNNNVSKKQRHRFLPRAVFLPNALFTQRNLSITFRKIIANSLSVASL